MKLDVQQIDRLAAECGLKKRIHLASRMDMPSTQLYRYLNNPTRWGPGVLEKLCVALGCTPNDILVYPGK